MAAPQRPAEIQRLRRIMQRLRAPDGCPWDRRQTLESLRGYLLEESYEAVEALDRDDAAAHAEELGDLLFQIVFQSHIRQEQGHFDLADVIDGICDKLERRHPHVFGDEEGLDEEQVAVRWHAMKRSEGKGTVNDVPQALPALMRAQKVGRRAARTGFDWPDVVGPLRKLREEIAELEAVIAAQDTPGMHAELGDVLFSVVNVARHLRVDAEHALTGTIERFQRRFGYVQRELEARGLATEEAELDVMNALWDEAKAQASS